MAGAILRYITVLATIAAIAFPQASGLLAGLGLSRGGQVVICTGDGLQVISLDASDAGDDDDAHRMPCAMTHAIGADAPPPEPAFHRPGWRAVVWTDPGHPDIGATDARPGARAPPRMTI